MRRTARLTIKIIFFIQSIKSQTDQHAESQEQVGKELTFKASDKFVGDINHALDLILKTYCDHIVKDVD